MGSKALSFFVIVTKIWIATWLYSVLLLLGGDVELNPGPKQSSINAFSICHWNLNSLSAHNYAKIFLLKAYIAIHRFDIICYLKHILILVLYLMITIWKYPVITWYGLVILQKIKEEVFVFIINIFCLWEFSMFNISKNALILKWKLATKFVTLYLFTDLPVKL